jgi:hypothetical protein
MRAGHSKLDGYSATLPAIETFPLASNRRSTASTAAFLASMRSCLRPSTHRRTSANTRSAGFRRVERPLLSHRLLLGKSRMVSYHAPAPLPRPEHLLNRLAADPPPLSPASIAPLAAAPTASAISWPSEPLIPFPDTDFLFRRYQPSAHPLCGAGALNMSLLPSPTPYTLSPLLKGGEGRGEGGSDTRMPCSFGALLVTLYHFKSKAFLM